MFPRAPRLVSFPCFSTAPSRFLSSFPRKLRGNQLVWAQNQPKRQNTGVYLEITLRPAGWVFCRVPRFRLRFCPRPALRLRETRELPEWISKHPLSGFPGNFRKRKVLETLSFPFWFPETWVQAKSRSSSQTLSAESSYGNVRKSYIH